MTLPHEGNLPVCFSATASFSIAGVLAPAGLYSVSLATRLGREWVPLAAYPLAFAAQQAIEGVLWLGMTSGDQATIATASRGFLFFSHFFWLLWVPFSVYCLEQDRVRRQALLGLTVTGALFGLSICLPALLLPGWLSVEQVQRSLEYHTTLIYDGIVERSVLRAVYAVIVLSALFLASDKRVRLFGGLIAASLVVTYVFFDHAFISVWCFFAAIISVCIVAILRHEQRRTATSAPLSSSGVSE